MDKPMAHALFLAAAILSASELAAQADSAAATGVVVGVVRDSLGNAMRGAIVAVRGLRVESNELGAFRLLGFPAGTSALRVRRVGYLPLNMQLVLIAGDTLTARLTLARLVTLDSIDVVEARSGIAEFEERRAQKVGHFITRADFERSPSRRVADFLARVPGLHIATNRSRSESFALSGRGAISMSSGPCYALVYLDGLPVYRGAPNLPFNLSALAAVDIEGIEYYRGGAGPRRSTTARGRRAACS